MTALSQCMYLQVSLQNDKFVSKQDGEDQKNDLEVRIEGVERKLESIAVINLK